METMQSVWRNREIWVRLSLSISFFRSCFVVVVRIYVAGFVFVVHSWLQKDNDIDDLYCRVACLPRVWWWELTIFLFFLFFIFINFVIFCSGKYANSIAALANYGKTIGWSSQPVFEASSRNTHAGRCHLIGQFNKQKLGARRSKGRELTSTFLCASLGLRNYWW